jgi:hypothetical protein
MKDSAGCCLCEDHLEGKPSSLSRSCLIAQEILARQDMVPGPKTSVVGYKMTWFWRVRLVSEGALAWWRLSTTGE